MLKIELEVSEPMETELRQLMNEGEYTSEAELAGIALAVFLRSMNHEPKPKLTDEELRQLEEEYILEDLEWGLQRPEEQHN